MTKTSDSTPEDEKIGVFGGSFNPPHIGHMRLAEEVAENFGLSRVLFVPSSTPPHKPDRGLAPISHRLEMTRLACEGNTLFQVSDIEMRLGGPSYTVNTLSALKGQISGELYFIIGSDSLREISTWHKCERLFEISNFIVVLRRRLSFSDAWAEVPQYLKDQFREQTGGYRFRSGKMLLETSIEGLNVSSTEIRRLIKKGKSIRYLVSAAVPAYIKDKKLYQD